MQDWKAPEQEKTERLPNHEELNSVFKQLAWKNEYEVTRKEEDEEGITLWEIEFPRLDQDDVVEFSYRRPKKNGDSIEIGVTIYEGGMPANGDIAARFINNKWEIDDSWAHHVVDETLMQKPHRPIETTHETREAEEEIDAIESLMGDFENTYSLEELLALTNITVDEANEHPLRKPAKFDLNRICSLLTIIKQETNITSEQYDKLNTRYQVLSKAVGRHTNKNIVVHD